MSRVAKDAIENNEIAVSWMVKLELQYLHEIGRVKVEPTVILKDLQQNIALQMSETELIAQAALKRNWTRDVFDRMIVAEAEVAGKGLITKDSIDSGAFFVGNLVSAG